MTEERIVEFIGSNWIATGTVVLVVGIVIGWIVGNYRGRRQAGSRYDSEEIMRENARLDFEAVSQKAEKITDLAREIADIARRAEKTAVKTRFAATPGRQRRFDPPFPSTEPRRRGGG